MLLWFGYVFLLHTADGFLVPEITAKDFNIGESVEVLAIEMTSVKKHLAFDYYQIPLHCRPKHGVDSKFENRGSMFRGNKPVNTNYMVSAGIPSGCSILCPSTRLSKVEVNDLMDKIQNSYRVHLLVDNVPSVVKAQHGVQNEVHYENGYLLGAKDADDENKVILHNHLKLILKFNLDAKKSKIRIVGFEIEPYSIDSRLIRTVNVTKCHVDQSPLKQYLLKNVEAAITLTYEVQWIRSDMHWTFRWNAYLSSHNMHIHSFSVINSIFIVLVLAGALALVLLRALRKDINRYNKEMEEELIEESGWKLTHGDVFRSPPYRNLLAALLGTGTQLFLMISLVTTMSMLGMISPRSRGALATSAIFLYSFMGLLSGYYAGRIYKTMKGQYWKRTAILTASIYPSVFCGACFFINIIEAWENSSSTIPFSSQLSVFFTWIGISLPLTLIGFYFGYRKQPYTYPVRTNQIPRQIPDQPWFLSNLISSLIVGLLPFGTLFIELYFIYEALWQNQSYYLYGYLFAVFVVYVISTCEVSIFITYFQLCHEDYRWWWKSFNASAGSSIYVFLYSIYYFFSKLEITGFVSTLIFFGYSFIIAFTCWLFAGTVGFYTSYIFVRKIYASIKID